MGIKGLKGKVNQIRNCKDHKVKLDRGVVIDGYNWMITLLQTTLKRHDKLLFLDHSEVNSVAERWARMMSNGRVKIKAVVFDGCAYPEKEAEKVKRYRERKRSFRRFLSIASGGRGEGRYNFRDKSLPFVMSPFTTRCFICALKRYKIPVLVTCCEADPHISRLANKFKAYV